MNELINRGVAEHLSSLAKHEYSCEDLVRAYLAEIERKEKTVGAFLTLDVNGAIDAARASDQRRANGEALGALDGIPFAVKDNFCTKALRTTCASKMLEHYVSPFDATAVLHLKNAGAVLLGKLNMDEFAMGSSTENSALGITQNPIAPDRVPGGSSGGSAAAVAACEVPFALGSDTGGSIRQPASFCGVVGFKPTYGAISRYGLIAMASSLDSVGIISQTAADAALIFDCIAGKDERDATSIDLPSFEKDRTSLRGLRIGVVRELCETPSVSAEIALTMEKAVECFGRQGALAEDVSLPSPDAALAAYCVLSAAESSSNLARYDGIAYGFQTECSGDLFSLYANSRAEALGDEVKRRILFGGYMLSKENRGLYYERANRARLDIKQKMKSLLEHYDLLLMPTAPTTAFPRGAKWTAAEQRRADLCSVYSSLAGLPSVSLPFGTDARGLPIGIQLTANTGKDRYLLALSSLLEEVLV